MTERCDHLHGGGDTGARCCLEQGHDQVHKYKCASPQCPGLTRPASVRQHPCDEPLEPCPIFGCGAPAEKGDGPVSCSDKTCVMHLSDMPPACWSALPRLSDAATKIAAEIQAELKEDCHYEGARYASVLCETLQRWFSCLSSGVAREPREVWGTLGPSGFVLQVFASREDAEGYIADREDSHGWTVELLVIRGISTQGECKGCKAYYGEVLAIEKKLSTAPIEVGQMKLENS